MKIIICMYHRHLIWFRNTRACHLILTGRPSQSNFGPQYRQFRALPAASKFSLLFRLRLAALGEMEAELIRLYDLGSVPRGRQTRRESSLKIGAPCLTVWAGAARRAVRLRLPVRGRGRGGVPQADLVGKWTASSWQRQLLGEMDRRRLNGSWEVGPGRRGAGSDSDWGEQLANAACPSGNQASRSYRRSSCRYKPRRGYLAFVACY